MRKLRYVTVDVFTDRQFGGNPLAVVLDAEGLSSQQMQAIATEFNYAETSFVLPPKDGRHTAQVRIFTPRVEVPFAGHPNVGTAFVVASLRPEVASKGSIVFEEAAGLVPIELLKEGNGVIGAELTAPQPLSFKSTVSPAAVASCVSLQASDLETGHFEPRVISVGLAFLVAELSSREALARAKPNMSQMAELLPLEETDSIYLFTRSLGQDEGGFDLVSRMFAPLDGILEDPATGSATAAVAALLATHSNSRDGELRMRVLQGRDMGRPSVLSTRVQKTDGGVAAVRIGGRCVPVMEGTLSLMA